ncbi:MAG: carboxypeptidase-like regulatory domain-containing protein [Bacteroidetes bacterium]|nr:carboxypeptidase-like regulatory domain-containing protein [Bacteroidota bacterium]MDA1018737.1 carboxypeptidase-like regulatory domain-containing protein [Bacteroidota bacterium]
MKKILLLIIILTNSFIFSQVRFDGVVTDSLGNAIMGANVIAIEKDTKILDGFGISNDAGYYKISLKKNTDYNIKVSFIGFKQVEFDLNVSEASEKNIILEEQAEALDEVELVYEMPVTIKGDTIVYNADSFNTGSEKKLGDVLKNLPGIEINDDGRIVVEGKEITKITIEGKDFFDGDSKLATQNLPASAVGKVEVLRNFTEVGQLRNVTNNEDNIAINIKLKSGKDKFWFGEILAGTGNEDRVLAAPKIFYYAKDFSMSVLGNTNNIGEPVLSRGDFYKFGGGFGNLNTQNGTSINISSDGSGIGSLQNNQAKSIDAQLGAYNFSHSPNDAWQISGFAILAKTKNIVEENIDRTYTITNTIEQTSDYVIQDNSQQLYKFTTEFKPNEKLQIEYNLLIKSAENEENTDLTSSSYLDPRNGPVISPIEIDEINLLRSDKPSSINQELKAYYTLNEDHIFSFEAQHLSQDEDPFYRAVKELQPFRNIISLDTDQSKFNINQIRNTNTNKMEGKLDYYYILTPKSNLNFTFGVTDVSQKFNSSIFQILDNNSNKNFDDPVLGNDVDFKFTDSYLSMHYRFITGIFTFDPGITVHSYKTENTQLGNLASDSYSDIRPDMRIFMKFKDSESLRFTYRSTTEFTDVNNLALGYVFNNYNSFFQGNPNLEAAKVYNYNLNYQSINIFTFTNVFARFSYSKRSNSIQNKTLISGISSVRSAVNSNFPRESYSASGRIDKRFKNFKAGFNMSFNYSDFNNIINGNPTTSINFTQNYKASLATNFRDKPNIEIGYSYNKREYDTGNSINYFFTDSPYARVDAYFGKGFVFTADYTYNYYRNDEVTLNKYRFLEADLSYNKEGSKWEFGLGVNNLFNDTSVNRDSFNQLYSQTRSYVVQPRYTVFRLKYDLSSYGGGKSGGVKSVGGKKR